MSNENKQNTNQAPAHEQYPTSISMRIMQGVGIISACAALVVGLTALIKNFDELTTEVTNLYSRLSDSDVSGHEENNSEAGVADVEDADVQDVEETPIGEAFLVEGPSIDENGVKFEHYRTRTEIGFYDEQLYTQDITLKKEIAHRLSRGSSLKLLEVSLNEPDSQCASGTVFIQYAQTFSEYVSDNEGVLPENDNDLVRIVKAEQCDLRPLHYWGNGHGSMSQFEVKTVVTLEEVVIEHVDISYWH